MQQRPCSSRLPAPLQPACSDWLLPDMPHHRLQVFGGGAPPRSALSMPFHGLSRLCGSSCWRLQWLRGDTRSVPVPCFCKDPSVYPHSSQ
jgi:hypothetical protein